MNPISDFKFISAVDNDNEGKRHAEKFKNAFLENLIVDIPFSMDFNEDLKRSKTKIRSFKFEYLGFISSCLRVIRIPNIESGVQ